EPDIRAILRRDALDEGALLALGAWRCVAADLPVAMHGLDRALRRGGRSRQHDACKCRNAGKRDPDQCTHGRTNVRGLMMAANPAHLRAESPLPLRYPHATSAYMLLQRCQERGGAS